MLNSIKLLGVKISNETEEKVSEYALEKVRSSKEKFFVTTPNPEILTYASSHPEYKAILNEAEVALPDGVGVLWGARILGRPVKSRITGTDFIEKLCRYTNEKPVTMGFLGGRGGVAEIAADRLQKKYPWIKVVFVGEEWSESGFVRGPVGSHPRSTSSASPAGAHRGTPTSATPHSIDILFVAYGFPKQEEWIHENLKKLPVKMAVGIGGAFDYISGATPRAPKFIRSLGFEWLFRLVVQPWRITRQLALFKFVYLVLKEKLK